MNDTDQIALWRVLARQFFYKKDDYKLRERFNVRFAEALLADLGLVTFSEGRRWYDPIPYGGYTVEELNQLQTIIDTL